MTEATNGPKIPKINYQGNSNTEKAAAKEPEAAESRVKPIEGISVTPAKKSLGRRVKENFGGQDLKSVGTFLLLDVVLPSARDLLFDLIQEGGRKAIYGDSARRPGSNIGSSIVNSVRANTTSYNSISSGVPLSSVRRHGDTSVTAPRERDLLNFGGWVVNNRGQAEEIIESMTDVIDEYGQVTVKDFYDLVGVSGNGFTDLKFGWDHALISRAEIRNTREGWVIDLPQPADIR